MLRHHGKFWLPRAHVTMPRLEGGEVGSLLHLPQGTTSNVLLGL